jgi:hypothetical protein
MQILNSDFTLLLQNKLEILRKMFSQGPKATGNEDLESDVNASLEWMYEMLISPIEKLLEGMEPEDKLIKLLDLRYVTLCMTMQTLDLEVWFMLTCFNSRHVTPETACCCPIENTSLSKNTSFEW